MSVMQYWGLQVKTILVTDASAALGVLGRCGLGKLRHIDTSYLWLQQPVIREQVELIKINGKVNPADMNTKGLTSEQINMFISALNMTYVEGRAELAPELNLLLHQMICKRFNSTGNRITKKRLSGQ